MYLNPFQVYGDPGGASVSANRVSPNRVSPNRANPVRRRTPLSIELRTHQNQFRQPQTAGIHLELQPAANSSHSLGFRPAACGPRYSYSRMQPGWVTSLGFLAEGPDEADMLSV